MVGNPEYRLVHAPVSSSSSGMQISIDIAMVVYNSPVFMFTVLVCRSQEAAANRKRASSNPIRSHVIGQSGQ